MQSSTNNPPQTFHMSLVEPTLVLVFSLFGIALAAGLFMAGIGDLFKTILLLLISAYGLFVAFSMVRKLEIAGSQLIVSYLVSKRVIAREGIDAYFLDEQGINRRTRKYVTVHLLDGRRIKFKSIREGNSSLLQALEQFTGFKAAEELTGASG